MTSGITDWIACDFNDVLDMEVYRDRWDMIKEFLVHTLSNAFNVIFSNPLIL